MRIILTTLRIKAALLLAQALQIATNSLFMSPQGATRVWGKFLRDNEIDTQIQIKKGV